MKIDIYRSAKNSTKYISVPSGTDINTFQFPADLDEDLHQLSPFKTHHEIIPGEPYVALDGEDVATQIRAKGYATYRANISVDVSVGKAP